MGREPRSRAMQTAALLHRTGGPHAYPLDSTHLRVMLQAARGDLTGVTCRHGDRYREPADDTDTSLVLAGSDAQHDYWVGTLSAPTRRVRYHFQLDAGGESYWLGERGPARERTQSPPFHYSYMNPADQFSLPPWLAGAVVYQIFCDRFQRSDPAVTPPGAGPWGTPPTWYARTGGDLLGIEQRLEWLQALGVSCLYLTPIFASPSCHRYDTRDYYAIDPMLGNEASLRSLVDRAHAGGMRLILDGVFNHSGQEFFAFQDAVRHGPRSPYWEWFHIEGERVQVGPDRTCNYETFAVNVPEMPKLMTQHPAVREFVLQVALYWLQRAGIDGWRLDVANEVDHRLWREFRERVRGINPEAYILGEVWVDALEWLRGDQFDGVVHYPWRDAVLACLTGRLDVAGLDAALTRQRFAYPGFVTGGLLHLIGSHDVPRILTAVGGDPSLARLAALLLFTAQGTPMLYYGDEVGMAGSWDPDNRHCMVWDPAEQDQETLRLYRRLGQIRRHLPWLNIGAWHTRTADAATGLYAYQRTSELALNAAPAGLPMPQAGEAIWVVLNTGRLPQVIELDDLPPGTAHLLDPRCTPLRSRRLRLPPHGFALLGNRPVAQRLRQQ